MNFNNVVAFLDENLKTKNGANLFCRQSEKILSPASLAMAPVHVSNSIKLL